MAKRTSQTKDLSGFKLYVYKDWIVEETSTFLYETTVNKYWKNGFSVLEQQMFTSDKLLNIKNTSIFKKDGNVLLEKCITLLGVPSEFIRNYKLLEYQPKCKK